MAMQSVIQCLYNYVEQRMEEIHNVEGKYLIEVNIILCDSLLPSVTNWMVEMAQ